MTDATRRAALDLLDGITGEGRLLLEMLPATVVHLPPAERARAQRLATETLRWADRADRMLGPHLRKRPPLRVLNALRLGTWEICADGAAAHGTVDALVATLKAEIRTQGLSGLANAVLRRIAGAGPDAWDALPLPQLPRPLRRRLRAAWGRDALDAIEAAHAAGAPLDLTPRDGDPERLAALLGAAVLPTGSVRVPQPGRVTALPGYDAGIWWVQDAAAALPVLLGAPQPGERALDLCAAPGGKTLQLAAAGADVTAVDVSARRMERLRQNLDRCGLAARSVVADATAWDEGGYDLVLLDAPCSATGTIRRHPDLPHAKPLRDLDPLLDLQARLLDVAIAAAAPAGRVVWCTCSLFPEEGETQIAAALARHPSLRVVPAEVEGAGDWPDGLGGLRTRPDHWADRGGLDGFHMACLARA